MHIRPMHSDIATIRVAFVLTVVAAVPFFAEAGLCYVAQNGRDTGNATATFPFRELLTIRSFVSVSQTIVRRHTAEGSEHAGVHRRRIDARILICPTVRRPRCAACAGLLWWSFSARSDLQCALHLVRVAWRLVHHQPDADDRCPKHHSEPGPRISRCVVRQAHRAGACAQRVRRVRTLSLPQLRTGRPVDPRRKCVDRPVRICLQRRPDSCATCPLPVWSESASCLQ